MINKYRVHEVAKDFDTKSNLVLDLLGEYFEGQKKSMTALEADELDVIFEKFTKDHEVEDLNAYFNLVKPEAKEKAETPAAEEKAPEAEAPKAAPAAEGWTCECGKTEGVALGHEYLPATENSPSICRFCGAPVGLTLKEQRDAECQERLDTAAQLVADKQYRKAIQLLNDGYKIYNDARLYWQMNEYRREMASFNNRVICAGKNNTVVISGGVIHMCGDSRYKEMGANGWGGVVAVAMGDKHLVALKQGGSVDAVGISVDKQYEGIKGLTGVAALAAGDFHSVALMEDGTVRSSKGYNHAGQCAVDSLMLAAGGREIVAVSAAYDHTVALLEDGTAVAVGDKKAYNNPVNGSCNVDYWSDIAAVYSGSEFSAGLRTDGTVVLSGVNWDVSGWTDIVNMAAGDYYLVGVREDGTVLAVGDPNEGNSLMGYAHVSSLKDVVYISAGHDHTVAVDKYGVVHCVGSNEFGQCDLNGMKVN